LYFVLQKIQGFTLLESFATVFSRFHVAYEMCPKEKYVFIHSFTYPLILSVGSRSISPRTTRNNSRSTERSDSSADSISRRDQV